MVAEMSELREQVQSYSCGSILLGSIHLLFFMKFTLLQVFGISHAFLGSLCLLKEKNIRLVIR